MALKPRDQQHAASDVKTGPDGRTIGQERQNRGEQGQRLLPQIWRHQSSATPRFVDFKENDTDYFASNSPGFACLLRKEYR